MLKLVSINPSKYFLSLLLHFSKEHNHTENGFYHHYFVLLVLVYMKITFGLMKSRLLLRLTDIRQCQPFWHVVFSLVLFHTATI